MPDIGAGIVAGGNLLGGIFGAGSAEEAAETAAAAQTAAANAAIAEQRAAREVATQRLEPFRQIGEQGAIWQQSLLGMRTPGEQAQIIANIAQGPELSALVRAGENAILQNAAATGGLRGGNVQQALADFRADQLARLINQRYEQFAGLGRLGLNAAAGVGSAGQMSANQISNLLGQQGAAQAGGALAAGQAQAGMWNAIPQGLGFLYGQGAFDNLGSLFGGVGGDAGISTPGLGTDFFGNADWLSGINRAGAF